MVLGKLCFKQSRFEKAHSFSVAIFSRAAQGITTRIVIIGEFDVLRDEGEAYAHKMMEAGLNVTACRYRGTINNYVMLNEIAGTPAARGAMEQASDKLRKVVWKRE